jgi:hypothetical protein
MEKDGTNNGSREVTVGNRIKIEVIRALVQGLTYSFSRYSQPRDG